MTHKMMVAAVVILLLVAIPFCITDVDSETDADSAAVGDVNVYYIDSSGSNHKTVQAFDLFQALESAKDYLGLRIKYVPGAESWNKDEGGYYNPNENYGTILSINVNGEIITDYDVYVYDNNKGTWVEAQDALGWYRPFEDYADTVTFDSDGEISAGAANIAIVNGGDLGKATDIQQLTPIDESEEFAYSFFLMDETESVEVPDGMMVTVLDRGRFVQTELLTEMLWEGVEIYGFGSDAYLALADAVFDDRTSQGYLVGQTQTFKLNEGPDYEYYTYYSWMDSLFNGENKTVEHPDGTISYFYWSSYTGSGSYLEYTLGYYSTISGAPNEGNEFKVVYIEDIYVPPEE